MLPVQKKNSTQIMISLSVPSPESTAKKEEIKSTPLEDEIRDALELIDSGHESHVEWIMINKVFKALQDRPKKSPRVQNLINMIQPVLSKYGYHGTPKEDY